MKITDRKSKMLSVEAYNQEGSEVVNIKVQRNILYLSISLLSIANY